MTWREALVLTHSNRAWGSMAVTSPAAAAGGRCGGPAAPQPALAPELAGGLPADAAVHVQLHVLHLAACREVGVRVTGSHSYQSSSATLHSSLFRTPDPSQP